MTSNRRFRSKPVEIEAIQATADNLKELQEFSTVREKDVDKPKQVAQVWDKLHDTWIQVYENQWIIKGTKGEFYPCDPEVFAEKYEEIV